MKITKVVGFNLAYTGDRAGHEHKVPIAHFLLYYYCLATMPCKHITRFVNNPDYRFAMVDTTNDPKVLKTSGLACQMLVDIRGSYKIYGSKKGIR
ncbi:hypothetical protein D1007_30523 [Hordeum vulgare]|nr:hypothetical protein D1007_30523 [Hordeum vulgare]